MPAAQAGYWPVSDCPPPAQPSGRGSATLGTRRTYAYPEYPRRLRHEWAWEKN
jgi:hypothetical protein